MKPIPPIKTSSGNWARSDEEKGRTFTEHLANIFCPIQVHGDAHNAEVKSYLDSPCQLHLPMKPLTPAEVRGEIAKTNTHKAPGYDLIVGEVLKHLPRKALVLLTIIYNSMLRVCYFPVQWKLGQIIMILKPGKAPTEAQSYRPISLLPLMSKVFEKLVLKKIKDSYPMSDLIPNHQFGFRENHSTVQQCHRLVHHIMESLDERKTCGAVFLDIQQAFDTVWHEGLLYKIKQQFSDQLYLLFRSYLSDRCFQVKVNNTVGSYMPIKSGVPQGSVLGPFLFLLYTADIPTTDSTLIATFADDTAILSTNENPVTASEKLQTHLNMLQDWFHKWRVKVNSNKSTQITFTLRRCRCPPVTFNNSLIPVNSEVKYLGLHLDSKLTWRTHILAKKRQLMLKAKQMSWLLGRRSQLSLESKLIIYKCIIKPIWTYGVELWGCSKPSNTKILQTFQSKTLRIMTNAPWYVTNQMLHEDLKIPYVKDVIQSHAMRYKSRIAGHENPLLEELSSQPREIRRLKKCWPEDLVR
ncbi:MAG: RNA-directed DNA polymerase [Candidatus Karelsulcia muelleri]